jgi:hypothetical protein
MAQVAALLLCNLTDSFYNKNRKKLQKAIFQA